MKLVSQLAGQPFGQPPPASAPSPVPASVPCAVLGTSLTRLGAQTEAASRQAGRTHRRTGRRAGWCGMLLWQAGSGVSKYAARRGAPCTTKEMQLIYSEVASTLPGGMKKQQEQQQKKKKNCALQKVAPCSFFCFSAPRAPRNVCNTIFISLFFCTLQNFVSPCRRSRMRRSRSSGRKRSKSVRQQAEKEAARGASGAYLRAQWQL